MDGTDGDNRSMCCYRSLLYNIRIPGHLCRYPGAVSFPRARRCASMSAVVILALFCSRLLSVMQVHAMLNLCLMYAHAAICEDMAVLHFNFGRMA